MIGALNFNPAIPDDINNWLESAFSLGNFEDIYNGVSAIYGQEEDFPLIIAKLAFLEASQKDFGFKTLSLISKLETEEDVVGFLNLETEYKYSLFHGALVTLQGEIYSENLVFQGKRLSSIYALIIWLGYLAGSISSAISIVIDHIKTRKQFDRPVGSFQLVQDHVVKVFIDFEYLKNTLYFICSNADPQPEKILFTLKTYSEEIINKLDLLIQACGGIGFTSEFSLNIFYTRALNLLSVAI